jgi:hypothetical protein
VGATYRAGSYNSATSSTSSLIVTNANGHTAGDLILLKADIDNKTGTVTWPAGFTQIVLGILNNPDGEAVGLAYKFDSGSEPSTYTITHTFGTSGAILSCTAWQNVDSTSPFVLSAVSTNIGANASPFTVSLTGLTAVAGDALLFLGDIDATSGSDTWSTATATGFTTLQNQSFSWANGFFQYKEGLSSGATGTISVVSTRTAGTGNAGCIGYQLALHAATTTTFNLGTTESANATDTQSEAMTASRTISETGSAVDTSSASSASFASAMAETGTAADTQAASMNAARVISEAGTATDTPSASLTATLATAESASALDTQSTGASLATTVTESATSLDTQAANKNASTAIAETGNALDSESAGMLASIGVTENTTAIDTFSTMQLIK